MLLVNLKLKNDWDRTACAVEIASISPSLGGLVIMSRRVEEARHQFDGQPACLPGRS